MMFQMLLLLFVPVAAKGTIEQVTSLLQGMLDASKADGEADHEVYAKFKCFCDTTEPEKDESITVTQEDVDQAEAQLADLRAETTLLSQEVAKLEADMAANEEARESAKTIRENEKETFDKTEADLETGISQLGRAIDLLAAVGADQTVTGDVDSAQLMAGQATEAAGGPAFLTKGHSFNGKTSGKARFQQLQSEAKKALNMATLFLKDDQKAKMRSFLQSANPFGNYNAQSGEIVGILKNMNDTFSDNLASARDVEAKAVTAYDDMVEVKTAEFDEMKTASDSKKETIGNNAADVAKTSTEVDTMKTQIVDDTEFLATLKERCDTKEKEYNVRKSLRASEEHAVSQAIAILAKVPKPESKGLLFLQTSSTVEPDFKKVTAGLLASAKTLRSFRLYRVAAAMKAHNPFTKVIEMINKTVALIEREQADDTEYKGWCEKEQSANEESKEEKETDMETLEGKIDELEISLTTTKESLATAVDDLKTNRKTQTETAATRKEEHGLFQKSLADFSSALDGLEEATKVLTVFYAKLHMHNAEKSYEEYTLKDSAGGNLERHADKSVEELEEICSANPECVGFNSAGWIKSSLKSEEEWYEWDAGSLYVKMLDGVPAAEAGTGTALLQPPKKALLQTPKALVQTPATDDGPALPPAVLAVEKSMFKHAQPMEGEPEAEFSKGQGSQGNEVIEMLHFISEETEKEKNAAVDTEQSSQSDFEEAMQGLVASEAGLEESISTYKLNQAEMEKQIEEAHEDLATTTKEHMAIVYYLEKIEPGCSFILTNYDTRQANGDAEKAALLGAIDTLKGTPAYLKAQEAAELEAMGVCGSLCTEKGKDHAECGACLEGVSVFGYCANPKHAGAPGCSEATATSSADALK